MHTKVAVIGAGNVGSMIAARVIDDNLADVVLVDIVRGLAKGKALDISDTRPITGSGKDIEGSEDMDAIKGASIVVITAGMARRPGMSRDDLLKKNASIVSEISLKIKELCPSSIIIVVTNPLDAMTFLVLKKTGFEPARVIGMAGLLDTARFINILSTLGNKPVKESEVFMMGSHGDTMVAINRSKEIDEQVFKEASLRAGRRGAEIVSCLETGSAFFAPSAAVFAMLKDIIQDSGRTACCSVYLQGQYGQQGLCMGVPCVLGSSGVKEIVEISLEPREREAFSESAAKIKEAMRSLHEFL